MMIAGGEEQAPRSSLSYCPIMMTAADVDKKNFFGSIALVLSTVRIQAEVCLWLIVVPTTVRSVFAEAGRLLLHDEEGTTSPSGWWVVSLTDSAATLAILVYIFHRRFSVGATVRARCWRRCRREGSAARQFSTRIALALGVYSLVCLAVRIFLKMASFRQFLAVGNFRSGSAKAFRAPVDVMVRDPILEEIFYRGVVFDRFMARGRMGPSRAAAWSSFLFGGVHLFHLLGNATPVLPGRIYYQSAMAACMGYVYCNLFYLSGSMFPAMILHALNNTTAAFYLNHRHHHEDPRKDPIPTFQDTFELTVVHHALNSGEEAVESSTLLKIAGEDTPSTVLMTLEQTQAVEVALQRARLFSAVVYCSAGLACFLRVRLLSSQCGGIGYYCGRCVPCRKK